VTAGQSRPIRNPSESFARVCAISVCLWLFLCSAGVAAPVDATGTLPLCRARSLARRASARICKNLRSAKRPRDIRFAFYDLQRLGDWASEAAECVLPVLQSDSADVRALAASCLGRFGRADRKVLSRLISTLHDEDSWVRWKAADALIALLSADRQGLSEVKGLLRKPHSRAFPAALYISAMLDGNPEQYVSALGRLYSSTTGERHVEVAWYIGGLGEKARSLTPQVISYMTSSRGLACADFEALAKIAAGDKRACRIALKFARWFAAGKTRDMSFLRFAVVAASEICPRDPQTMAFVESLVRSGDSGMRSVALSVLKRVFGKDADRLAALLVEVSKDRDSINRMFALDLLAELPIRLGPAELEKLLSNGRVASDGVAFIVARKVCPLPNDFIRRLQEECRTGSKWALYARLTLALLPDADERAVTDFVRGISIESASGREELAAYQLARVRHEGVELLCGMARRCRDEVVRMRAMEDLASLGARAQSAVPTLLEIAENEPQWAPLALYAVRCVMGLDEFVPIP